MKKASATKSCFENKILLKDLRSISDQKLHEFMQKEQRRIMKKRGEQQDKELESSSTLFCHYFDGL